MPANEATCRVLEYLPVAGSIFCAVPVFPPEEYPLSCASLPVPNSTTPSIILRICAAVSVESTRCAPGGSGLGRSLPGLKGEGLKGAPCRGVGLWLGVVGSS